MRYICLLVFLFIYCQAHARDMPLVKKGPFDTVADTSLPDSVLQKPNLIDSKVENLQNGINSEYFLSDSLFEKNPVNRGAEKIEDSRQRIVAADDSIRRKIQNIIPDSLRNIVPDGAAGLPKAEIPELDTPSINSLN